MATSKTKIDWRNTIHHWECFANDIHFPLNDDDYNKLSNFLDRLLDIVGDNESHKLIGLVDVVSHMISMYDEQKMDKSKIPSGVNALKFLMEQHSLNQKDLPEIGSQGVVSEILNGKRELNLRQIKLLSRRFRVSVDTFID